MIKLISSLYSIPEYFAAKGKRLLAVNPGTELISITANFSPSETKSTLAHVLQFKQSKTFSEISFNRFTILSSSIFIF